MKRALAVLVLTGCAAQPPDVCGGEQGACVALELVDAPGRRTSFDAVHVVAPELAIDARSQVPGAHLPAILAVVPRVEFTGPFSLAVAVEVGGVVVATATMSGRLGLHEHQLLSLTVTPSAGDLAMAGDLAGADLPLPCGGCANNNCCDVGTNKCVLTGATCSDGVVCETMNGGQPTFCGKGQGCPPPMCLDGTKCIPPNAPCSTGGMCNQGMCTGACGGFNQPCCPGSVCVAGSACNGGICSAPDGGSGSCNTSNCTGGNCCRNGQCVMGNTVSDHCGTGGQECQSCVATLSCTPTGQCASAACMAMGGGSCCPGAVCAGQNICAGATCLGCGQAGQSCCPGGFCASGCCVANLCISVGASCSMSNGGTCQSSGQCDGPCGGSGEACCPTGTQCLGATLCMNGRCVDCGGVGKPCCSATSGSPCGPGANCCDPMSRLCLAQGMTCTGNTTCQAGSCGSASTCSAANCGGCCAGNTCVGIAQESNSQCGTGGAPCVTCSSPATCQSGACSASCAASCSSGCCSPPSCTPKTCLQVGAGCGMPSDGCGNNLSCGGCTSPQTCGGGGVPFQCGSGTCTPITCAQQNINCGFAGDGCSGIINCGTCTPPAGCGLGGFGLCGAPSSCMAPTAATCGSGGATCVDCNQTVKNATSISCAATGCSFTCKPGFLDCDGIASNGCELMGSACPPAVSGFTPSLAPIGTSVTINGSGFSGATQVKFNAVASTFSVSNNTTIGAAVPAGATDGPICVVSSAGSGCSTASFVVTLMVATTSLPNGMAGSSYVQQMAAQGGQPPYSWTLSSGTLPPGTMMPGSGLLSGTPSASGSYVFTVKAADSAAMPQTAAQQLTLTIN